MHRPKKLQLCFPTKDAADAATAADADAATKVMITNMNTSITTTREEAAGVAAVDLVLRIGRITSSHKTMLMLQLLNIALPISNPTVQFLLLFVIVLLAPIIFNKI